MNRLVRLFCALLLSLSAVAGAAQNLGTGLYPFGTFDSRGFDSINIGNLNTHFQIPIVNKQGRGLNFAYSLVYDGLIWSPTTSGGTQYWQPDTSWGFHGQLGEGLTGEITYRQIQAGCTGGTPHFPIHGITYTSYVYHDQFGKNHSINLRATICPNSGSTTTGDGSTSDGSGLYYNLTDYHMHTARGETINAPEVEGALSQEMSGGLTDSNGNTITNNGNGTFTDTLGVTELTIGGGGNATSPLTFTYPVTLQSDSATAATVTVYYKTYTVQTNFQCPAISEYGATSVDLIDHITFPDAAASTYSFTYETTPGVSGAVTGRLASITLPTGGTISYSYSGGCSSAGTGINTDGTVGSLTRVTSDGTRTYTRATVNANATSTTMQDEKGNQSAYQFSFSGGMFYETHRQVYQGAVGGSILLDRYTCYNGATPPCDGAVITPPFFTQDIVVSSYNGGAQDSVSNTYDANGMLTSSVQGQWGGSALLKQIAAYNSMEEPTSVSAFDALNGLLLSTTTYGYDETTPTTTSGIPQHSAVSGARGNETSSHVVYDSGYDAISTTTAYYDTGAPVSTTTPNGVTQYSYDSTQTFATKTILPTPSSGVQLATSASYDPQSGVQISSTGMNSGQTAQATQYDRLLRPVNVVLPNGGTVYYSYDGTNQIGVFRQMNGSQNTDTETLYDAYGRKSRVAVNNGQASNSYYQTDYCYDATGLLQFQSVQYQGSGWGTPKQCSGNGTSYTYDALGRRTSSTNVDGTAYYQYNGRAVMTTSVNGVQKIIQHDFVGRISSVCEISSNSTMPGSGSPQACGADIAGNGFLTTYSYTGNTTTIAQGVQTRTFVTDYAGRTTSVTEPERGLTTYSYVYNGTGLVVTRQRPEANQGSSSIFTTTTTQYDSVGRPIGITYNDGLTPNKYYSYDMTTGWNGLSLGESAGQLTYAWTSLSGSTLTGTQLAYDSMGNVIQSVQCLPNRCGNSTFNVNLLYSYDLGGNLTKSTYFTQANTSGEVDTNYIVNIAGQVIAISNTLSGTTNYSGAILSNIQDGPDGPISYQYGNGLTGNSVYDAMGRLTGKNVACGSTELPQYGCYGYAYYPYYMTSTIKGSEVTQLYDSSLNRNLTMSYDEFGRLISAADTAHGISDTYSYDRWGNRWTQNVSNYEGNSPQLAFNTATNQVIGATYDAAGNLSNGSYNYKYDAEGNLLAVGAGASSDIYDAFNNRVQSSGSGTTYQYAFNPWGQRVSEWQPTSSTPTMVEAVTYWNGQPVAYYDGNGTSFIHQDALGTKRAETNYQYVEGNYADNLSTYTSLPFGDGYGDGYGNGGIDGDAMHFALLDRDSASGTEHAQFRQYYSGWGRWMSPDPYDGSYSPGNPQSFNRYTYALNNPLSATDPSGLKMPSTTILQFTGGPGLIFDGNQPALSGGNLGMGFLGSQSDEFQTIETVSSPDGDGSYSYTEGGWSSIAGSDTGNIVNPDGSITSSYDGGFGGTVTSSLVGFIFQSNPPESFAPAQSFAPNNQPQPKPPQPQRPQHFWQKPGCSDALGNFGVGLLGSALTTGAVAAAFIVGPEELVGFEGAATLAHVGPVGVPGFILMSYGGVGVARKCF